MRIFHGLNRFSEDFDFSLLAKDEQFSIDPYLESMITEFQAAGMDVSIKEKKKAVQTKIESAFLKSETVWKELVLEGVIPQAGLTSLPSTKIKLEVDTDPPLGFKTEENLLLKPFSFYVKRFTLPDLFAGKMHALLFRNWKARVKGRDWYDLEWYIRKAVPLHLQHFVSRAQGSGSWKAATMTADEFRQLLEDRIATVSFKAIRDDVIRFIPNEKGLEIWSPGYFRDLVKKIKFQ